MLVELFESKKKPIIKKNIFVNPKLADNNFLILYLDKINTISIIISII